MLPNKKQSNFGGSIMFNNLINQAVEFVANIDYSTLVLKAAFWTAEQAFEVLKAIY